MIAWVLLEGFTITAAVRFLFIPTADSSPLLYYYGLPLSMVAAAVLIALGVADRLRAHSVGALVVDPVMVAKSGDALLRPEAVQALLQLILPMAAVVTPNAPEAAVLSGVEVTDAESAREAARRLHNMSDADRAR